MGVDFYNRRIVGFSSENDLNKLPKDIQDILIEEREVYGSDTPDWDGLYLYTENYGKGEFVICGFNFQTVEFNPVLEEQPPLEKIKLFKKYGIDAAVYSFVDQC